MSYITHYIRTAEGILNWSEILVLKCVHVKTTQKILI